MVIIYISLEIIQQITITQQINQSMATDIEIDIMHMLEDITINAGVEVEIESLDILLDHQFYFQICQAIFPELNINLLTISENNDLQPHEKMQRLIQLLSRQSQLDLSSISGTQILKGHLIHMHKFLRVLQKFSEYHPDDDNRPPTHPNDGPKRHKSDPNTSGRIQMDQKKPSRSARNLQITGNSNEKDSTSQEQNRPKIKQKFAKRKNPNYSADIKKMRSRKEERKNLYGSVINILVNEKNRTMDAAMRDNRKRKNSEIEEAKNKYKSYLINHKNQTRASRVRKELRKPPKQAKRQLPLQDFDNLQKFFESFAYKYRDLKYCYLKKIQKKIHVQEIDRMCYQNRIKRQNQSQNETKTKKLLDRINNQHKIRNNLLQQRFDSQKQGVKLMQKQYQRYLRTQKKQLKNTKKKQMNKIKEFIEQENQKVLMNLQEGGNLEKIILDMYKRF